jgi:hypothetical protein
MPKTHTVKQGECLGTIAATYGFTSWKKIYDAPENADLRRTRPNPNVLKPGDQIVIPDGKPIARKVSSGAVHTITVPQDVILLRLEVPDEGTFKFKLKVGNDEWTGEVSGPGMIERPVNPRANRGELSVWPTQFSSAEEAGHQATIWDLFVGHLDPVDTIEGVQARLISLGYFSGEIDGNDSPELAAALRDFQTETAAPSVSGQMDAETRKALVDRFGC